MSNILNNTTLTDGITTEFPFVGDSHFFIEEDTVFSQTAIQSFGPKTINTFKTTSKITFSGTKKVFAICNGKLLIQPQLDGNGNPTNLVNAVLMPTTQPVKGLPIKYIVYRGLNSVDFINTNQNPQGRKIKQSSTVPFVQDAYSDFYDINDNSTDFWTKYIGYPTSSTDLSNTGAFAGAVLLNDLFSNKSTVYDPVSDTISEDPSKTFVIPSVTKGLHIGNASSELGIDVVLDLFDTIELNGNTAPFKLDLDYARSVDHFLDTSDPLMSNFDRKIYKEACLQFMDIAALIGIHANGCSLLATDGMNSLLTTTSEVYAKMAGFDTKNKVYLSILSHRGRSYNFYDQHISDPATATDNIQLGFTESTTIPQMYGTLQWPMEVIDFSSNSSPDSKLFLKLYTKNPGMITCYNLLEDFAQLSKNGFYQIPQDDQTTLLNLDYTGPIALRIREEDTGTSPIAQAHFLLYEGSILDAIYTFDDNGTPVDQPLVLDRIQSVFGVQASTVDSLVEGSRSKKAVKHTVFSMLNNADGTSVVSSKEHKDYIKGAGNNVDERITIETIRYDSVENNANSNQFNNTEDKFSSTTVFYEDENNFYLPKKPSILIRKRLFTEDEAIFCLKVEDLNGKSVNKLHLGILESEYQNLLNEIAGSNILNPTVFLYKRNSQYDFSNQTFGENDLYEFDLLVAGDTENEKVRLYPLTNPVSVYTIDGKYFFSKAYGDTTNQIDEILDEENSHYEPTASFTAYPPTTTGLINPTNGVIVRGGKAVDVSDFLSYNLDTEGFLVSFTDRNGVSYKRFYGVETFKTRTSFNVSQLTYNDYDEGNQGLFLRTDDYLSFIQFPSTEDDRGFKDRIVDRAFQLREFTADNNNEFVQGMRISPNYGSNGIEIQYIHVRHHQLTDFHFYTYAERKNKQYRILDDLFDSPAEQSTVVVPLDPHVLSFKNRTVSTAYFTGLSSDEQEEVFEIVAKICFGMEKFIRENRAILERGRTSVNLTNAINDQLIYWRDTLTLDTKQEIVTYKYHLSFLNHYIFKDQRHIEKIDADQRISYLLTLLPMNGMASIATSLKILYLSDCLRLNDLHGSQQHTILKILYSEETVLGAPDKILDFLATIQGSSQTNFERLYHKMNEVEWYSQIPLALTVKSAFGGEDNHYRRHYNFAVYRLWQKSKYSYFDVNSDGTVDLKPTISFFGPGQKGAKFVDEAPKMMVFDTDNSGKVVGEGTTNYIPDRNLNGVLITFREIVRENTEFTYEDKEEGEITTVLSEVASNKRYGDYHIFQPILAIGFTSNLELKLSQPVSVYPAFLHYYAKQFTDIKKTAALVGFAFDIALEAILFWGTGGVSTFRHLRHFVSLTKAGKAMMGISNARIVLSFGTITLELSAGLAQATATLITQTTQDPQIKEFYEKLGMFFLGVSFASSIANSSTERFVKQKARECMAVYDILTPAQKTAANVDVAVITEINKFSFDWTNFKGHLDNNNMSDLSNEIAARLNSPELKASFHLDFNKTVHTKPPNWKGFNKNLHTVENWKKLHLVGNIPLTIKTKFFILQNSNFTDIVKTIYGPNLKRVIDDLSEKEVLNFTKSLLKEIDDLPAKLLILPHKPVYLDLFKTAFLTTTGKQKSSHFIKYEMINVLDLMNSTLHDLFAEVVNIRNKFTDATAVQKAFRENSHIKVSWNPDHNLNPVYKPEVANFCFPFIDSTKTKYLQSNLLEYELIKTLHNGNTVTDPAKMLISGSKDKQIEIYGTKPQTNIPEIPNTISTFGSQQEIDNFYIFANGSHADHMSRINDTEAKFVYRFLQQDFTGVQHIDINLFSLLRPCDSCQGFLVALVQVFNSRADLPMITVNFRAHESITNAPTLHTALESLNVYDLINTRS